MSSVNHYLTCVILILAACGGGRNPDREALDKIPEDQRLGREKFSMLSEAGGASLSLLKFTRALDSVSSAVHYKIHFQLDVGGQLSLITHASAELRDGIVIRFSRPEGQKLQINATAKSASGEIIDDWSAFAQKIDASKPLSFSVDIHNNESPAHVLIWVDDEREPLLDSGVDVDGAPGRGWGIHWGLQLSGARVQNIDRSLPKYAH